MFKIIKTKVEFYHIISWNIKYLIVAAYGNNAIWIVDFDGNINKGALKSVEHPICVQKMILNEKEVILCACGQGYNSLYIYYDHEEFDNKNSKK